MYNCSCMKKITKILSLSLLALLGVSFAVTKNSGNNVLESKATAGGNGNVVTYDYTTANSYHSSNNASSLLTTLRNLVKNGSAGSYNDLWNAYKSVYVKSNGKMKDYYSSASNFTPGTDQAGNYSQEGDVYNREHSIPKSWWGGAETNQGADIFIVIPTDGFVNNKRSNYPLGMVKSATYTSSGDFSKLGSADTSYGYSGTVFEPDDSVKGDLARITFYAIARYSAAYGWTSGEGSSTFSGSASTNFGLTPYAVKLFTYWNNLDKPDDWERSINDKGSKFQGNRNPFIDHPEYVNTLWGSVSGATTYSEGQQDGITSISKTSTSITVGGTDTINAVSSNSETISWSSNNTNVVTVSSSTSSSGSNITITGVAAGTATITASITISGHTYSKTCAVTVTSSGGGQTPVEGDSETIDLTAQGYSSGDSVTSVSGTYSSIAFNKGDGSNDPKYYSTGSAVRCYPGNTVVISSASKTIVKIEFTFGSGDNDNEITANTGTYSDGTWTGSASSVTFTIGGSSNHRRISSIKITYEGSASPVSLSSITVSGGTRTFTEGDGFSFGGTVTAHYSDSSTANVTSAAEFSGYDLTETGNQTVTVSYGGKSTTYNIAVNLGTLSSISVYGYSTSYGKNSSFSFDGTCIATFANGYDKEVEPTSVSSPDMSTAGNKTITVSLTYNGVTKTKTYQITVTSYRTVYESGYFVIGTIDYTDDEEIISTSSLSTSASGGYSKIDTEYHAWRLGAGSKIGTLTVNSTTSDIRKIVVNAKYYSSDSGTTFTIAGTSNTLTNTYTDYTKEFNTATNSVAISSVTNGKRVLIASITVYTYGGVDISTSSDCVGLETFIGNNMHMDYTSNLGYCKDNTHHYYSTAKTAFNGLNEHQRALFTTNTAYSLEWARLSKWASINGDSLNASNILESNSKIQSTIIKYHDNTSIIVVVVSLLGITALGGFLFIKHRKEEK